MDHTSPLSIVKWFPNVLSERRISIRNTWTCCYEIHGSRKQFLFTFYYFTIFYRFSGISTKRLMLNFRCDWWLGMCSNEYLVWGMNWSLNLNYITVSNMSWGSFLQRNIPTVKPGIESETSWLTMKNSEHHTMNLISFYYF